jgi:hypothetical protein
MLITCTLAPRLMRLQQKISHLNLAGNLSVSDSSASEVNVNDDVKIITMIY